MYKRQQYAGASITYEWTNGAGVIIGTTRSITVIPTTANDISPFRVSVNVDGCISPLATPVEVIVNQLPDATATNAGDICPGSDAQLFANPIPGATYEWRDLGTGAIVSTEQNPMILGLDATTTYELTVNAEGCISNPLSQTTIVVNDEPTVMPEAFYTLNNDCSPNFLGLRTGPTIGCLLYTSPSPRD